MKLYSLILILIIACTPEKTWRKKNIPPKLKRNLYAAEFIKRETFPKIGLYPVPGKKNSLKIMEVLTISSTTDYLLRAHGCEKEDLKYTIVKKCLEGKVSSKDYGGVYAVFLKQSINKLLKLKAIEYRNQKK